MRLVFATQNAHKAAEVNALVGEGFEILSLKDINCGDDIAEYGKTLEENAIIKARYIYQKYEVDCFADDTGLVTEALDGEPGVYSARYAGNHKSDKDNINLLLEKLANKPNRRAAFETVICLILKGEEIVFTGKLDGHITELPRGSNGFGYDPVFVPDGSHLTLAELSLEEKNKISHRAKAFNQLKDYLVQVNSSDQS